MCGVGIWWFFFWWVQDVGIFPIFWDILGKARNGDVLDIFWQICRQGLFGLSHRSGFLGHFPTTLHCAIFVVFQHVKGRGIFDIFLQVWFSGFFLGGDIFPTSEVGVFLGLFDSSGMHGFLTFQTDPRCGCFCPFLIGLAKGIFLALSDRSRWKFLAFSNSSIVFLIWAFHKRSRVEVL